MQCAASLLPYEAWCTRRAGKNATLPRPAHRSMTMRTPIVATCSRCGDVLQCSTWEEISLCLSCLRLVVLEWAARHSSFTELDARITQVQRESLSQSRAGRSDSP